MINYLIATFAVLDILLLVAIKRKGLQYMRFHASILLIPQVLLVVGYVLQIPTILAFTASVLIFMKFYELVFIAVLAGIIIEEHRELFAFAAALSLFVSFHYFFRLDYTYATWELFYRIAAIFIIMTASNVFRILFIAH